MQLTSFEASSYMRDMAHETIEIDRLSLSIVGGIQPARLADLIEPLSADGLGARFLMVTGTPEPLEVGVEPIDDRPVREVLRVLRTLEMVGTADATQPRETPFDADASDRLVRIMHRARARQEDHPALLGSMIGKAPGMIARLALVIAHLEGAVEGVEPASVTLAHVKAAEALWFGSLWPMAQSVLRPCLAGEDEHAAIKVARELRNTGRREVSPRDILRMRGHGSRTVEALAPVLAILEKHGLLRWLGSAPSGPSGGRPRPLYAVNPGFFKGS